MADLLVVEDLSVEYINDDSRVQIVDRVSFSIAAGESFGLAGESGSGKSTIAQAILRVLIAPAVITSGRVLFKGEDILDMSEQQLRKLRWREISLVMQSAMNALNPVMTIGQQIGDVIEVHEGKTRKQARARAAKLLEMVGLETGRLDSYPHQLSGGQRQRVVIAIALALEPSLVMMDEPTTALDVVMQKEIMQQIAELKEQANFSVLFITHDLSLMLQLCQRVGMLYAGRLVEAAPSEVLLREPRHPYTQALMQSFPDARAAQHDLVGIPGTPPSPKSPPSGCRFHPRCREAMDECAERQPPLIQLASDHVAACHLLP